MKPAVLHENNESNFAQVNVITKINKKCPLLSQSAVSNFALYVIKVTSHANLYIERITEFVSQGILFSN